jgi:hypothetical protein
MKIKKLSKNALVNLGVAVAKGVSRRKIMSQDSELPERLVRELQKVRLGESEYRERVTAALEDAALESLESFRADLRDGKVSPSTKPIAAGIFFDKIQTLHSRSVMHTANVCVQVNEYGSRSREEIMHDLLLPWNGDAQQPIAESVHAIGSKAVINVQTLPPVAGCCRTSDPGPLPRPLAV